jgi:hypothetical protein
MFNSRFLSILTAVLSLSATVDSHADEMKPVRVGVLGLDNYQAVAYTQLFNNPKASGDLVGVRVVAALSGECP